MSLIAVLIALALERYYATVETRRRFVWFSRFSGWIRSRPGTWWNGAAGVLLAVSPALALGYVLHLIGPVLGFVAGIAVLVFCLGPVNLLDRAKSFIDAWQRGDKTDALQHAARILGGEPPAEEAALMRSLVQALLSQFNERLLAVLFWFVVLGPLGAALFRLAGLLREQARQNQDLGAFDDAALRLHGLLNWLPARLTALSYAVAGSFADAVNSWRSYRSFYPTDWPAQTEYRLVSAGLGALQFESEAPATGSADLDIEDVRFTLALGERAILVWLVVLFIVALASMAV